MPYLNSAVFYTALKGDWFDLVELPPRNMAAAMHNHQLDAGPLPIAEVIRMKSNLVQGTLGVAVEGHARSVLLFSNLPAEDLSGKSVAVTGHTSTSVQLMRILFAEHWQVANIALKSPDARCEAQLLIGDPALKRIYGKHKTRFVYDLSFEWKKLTGLPFVFARWVARSDASSDELGRFAETLHRSFNFGIANLQKIADQADIPGMTSEDVKSYVRGFTYELGEPEFAAIDEFQAKLSALPEWQPEIIPYSTSP